jgi:hypothetical protein
VKLRKYETAATRERQPDGLLERTAAMAMAAAIIAFVAAVVASIIAPRFIVECAALGLLPLAAHAIQLVAHGLGLDVPREAQSEERIRLVRYNTRQLVDDVDRDDLAFFVREVARSGKFTQRAWTGRSLPSGATCDATMHAQMVGALEKAGFVVDRGPRSAGRLTCRDGDEMLRRMGL